jgi:hypothetical protein
MSKADFLELKHAVEEFHACEANYVSSEHVRESWGETLVFDGMVSLFGLTGHPVAVRCYAWLTHEPGAKDRTLWTALCIPPIEKGRDAVLASLALRQRRVTPAAAAK